MKITSKKFNNLNIGKLDSKTSTRDRLLGTAILVVAALLFIWLTVLIFRPMMKLASDPEKMRDFVHKRGAFGKVAFLGIQVLQGLVPIPLELTTVAAGYVFGQLQGCIITVCSTVISTTMIFYCTKIFGRKVVNLFFDAGSQRKIQEIHNHDKKLRDFITIVVFLIPGAPKRLFVFTAAFVPQQFSKFLIITTLARTPSLIACSFGGSALGSGDYKQAVAIFIITGAVSVIGLIFYRFMVKAKKKRSDELADLSHPDKQ